MAQKGKSSGSRQDLSHFFRCIRAASLHSTWGRRLNPIHWTFNWTMRWDYYFYIFLQTNPRSIRNFKIKLVIGSNNSSSAHHQLTLMLTLWRQWGIFKKRTNLIHKVTAPGHTLLQPASLQCWCCLPWLISHSFFHSQPSHVLITVPGYGVNAFCISHISVRCVSSVLHTGICGTLQWVLRCFLDSLGNALMNKAFSNPV